MWDDLSISKLNINLDIKIQFFINWKNQINNIFKNFILY
jgi:hypothetical protein